MMLLREPRTAASLALGALSIANPTARRRRLMLSANIPLAQSDGIQPSDPITAILPGTGRNELAQVEPDVLVPYADEAQKCIRVMFPVVIDAGQNDMRVDVQRSGAGIAGPFVVQPNVQLGFEALGVRFFCGPSATHFVDLKIPGAPLPTPIQGIRSRRYTWTARVYEPAHAPTLRTEWHATVEIEILDGQDYAEFWVKAVNCDPRVTDPNGMDRSAWSDADTELGFEFIVPNQNLAQPVPFAPEQCVVSLAYATDRWRWVMDSRLSFNGQIVNQVLPWGIRAAAEGVILFRGQTGSLGEQLRDDSLQAWIDWPSPIEAVSDQWRSKPTAWVVPHVRRPYKHHEHFDQNRDYNYVRDRLRTQTREVIREAPSNGRPYLWGRGSSAADRFTHKLGVDTTGDDFGWTRTALWESMAYMLPDMLVAARRWVPAWGSPIEFLNADGTKVTGLNEPNLNIEVLAPGQRLGNGTLLGKSAQPAWRGNQNIGLLRLPITGTPVVTGKDRAHFEFGMPFALAALSPSRLVRDFAHTIAYTTTLGNWMPTAWTNGVTDQPRAFGRGITMFGWASWVFGSDPAWVTRLDQFRTQRLEVAEVAARAAFGVAPRDQRRYRMVTIQQRNQFGGAASRVDLTNYDYGRWWEDAHGVLGAIAINHHMVPRSATLNPWAQILDDYLATHIYVMPRGVDANGRVEWTVRRPASATTPPQPPTIYQPMLCAAVLGTNLDFLTQQQFEDNNWTQCGNENASCGTANSGFVKFGDPGGSADQFCMVANGWISLGYGASDQTRLVRYAYDHDVGRFGIVSPINRDVYFWLTRQIWSPFADHLHVPTSQTLRANIGFTPTGVAMLSNGRLAVTRQDSPVVSIVDIANGVVQTLTPRTTANWSGVVAHDTKVLLLNGYDPNLNRVTRWFWSTDEQINGPGGGITWVLDTIEGRDFRGAAYDPITQSYLSCGYRLGRTTIWRVPLTGGPSMIDPTIFPHEDFDTQPQSIAISQDGKLLAMGRTDGTVWLHTRALGGYWSQPRLRVQRGGWVTFTRHNREDDALRLVSISEAGQIVESEV